MKKPTQNDAPKVLVIGLDGGNLEVLRRLAAQGHVPFLASIFQRGTSGLLRSVFPPSTAPAWSTFMTGKNPGKHGVFEFFSYENSGAPLRVVNSSSLKAETLWSLLGRAGKRVGVVNVPMTYPPQPVNGTMITGILTPSTEQTFTYPPELSEQLPSELGEYVIHIRPAEYGARRIGRFIADLVHCAEQRGKYTRRLMQREPWDFFMVVFSETDSLQHAAWSYLDPKDDRHQSAKIERAIHDFFGRLDDEIRAICAEAGENTRVFFVSDHGFGPLLKYLNINTWLMQQGWLVCREPRLKTMRRVRKLRQFVQRVDPFELRKLIPRKRKRDKPGYRTNVLPLVQWERTKAFSVLRGEQGIRINLKGREPHGTVEPGQEYEELRDAIIDRLGELRDTETGEKVVEAIWKREEIYSGPYVERAADIVFCSGGGRWAADVFPAEPLLERPFWLTGTHRMDGMFAACGPGIRAQAPLENAHLQDLVPTLLYALRLPIPSDVDGRVLREVYGEDVLAGYEPELAEPGTPDPGSPDRDFSAEEEKQVMDRLRGLGYIE